MSSPDLLDNVSLDAEQQQQQQQTTRSAATPSVEPDQLPESLIQNNSASAAPPPPVVVETSGRCSADSTGVPYSTFNRRRGRSSPLAAMESSPTSDAMKTGTFPLQTVGPVSDESVADTSEENDENHFNNNHDSYKNNSTQHDSRRVWFCIGGAIFLVVLIAAIAAGAVTSSNNNKEAAAAAAAAANTASGNGGMTTAGGGSVNIPLNPQDGDGDSDGSSPNKSELYLFIESLLPDGGLSLQDPQSYQSLALQYIESTHNKDYSLQRVTQRFVLACIYHATYKVKTTYTDYALGANSPIFPWLDAHGWLDLEIDTPLHECEWFGIRCNNVTNMVESIDLHENLLTGSFPPETALLAQSLLVLDLEENIVYNAGSDGLDWLGKLSNLQELNLAKTSFQYDYGIPPVIGQLTNLVELDVSYSLFFGPLQDAVFENLRKLQFLYIGGNSYNSSLPLSIGRLDSLLYLYAEYTDLVGDLSFLTATTNNADGGSSSSVGLSSIYELWIDKNPNLSSTIPTQIGQLTTLASLSITECDLYGDIPTEMGNLINMRQLWLYGNRLSGDIPTTLGALGDLDRLELEDNELYGDMPSELCANVYPRGRLEVLEADCSNSSSAAVDDSSGAGKISCNATDCCTCCGPQCAVAEPQSLRDSTSATTAGEYGTSSGVRRDPNRDRQRKQRRLNFVQGQQQQQRSFKAEKRTPTIPEIYL
jgi:hypothetical protein